MEHWWVYQYYHAGMTIELLSWVFWVLLSVTLHELGHGWMAMRLGDQTPELTGHMTLNPLVHMGPFSLIVFVLTGIAWGTMPVDPTRFRMGRHGDALVSLAGPAVNLGLAVVCFVSLLAVMKFVPEGKALSNVAMCLLMGVVL